MSKEINEQGSVFDASRINQQIEKLNYAKQMALGFVEWASTHWQFMTEATGTGAGIWSSRNWKDGGPIAIKSNEQMYNDYMTHLTEKPSQQTEKQ
jgi:hypothetical protein